MEIEELVGMKVESAQINNRKDHVVLKTDKGTLYLSWVGDCCAHCYLENFSGIDFLIDSVIVEAAHAEWKNIEKDEDNTLESMGTILKTSKRYVSFESRVSHNGYYGGWIEISKTPPRYTESLTDLKPLEDF